MLPHATLAWERSLVSLPVSQNHCCADPTWPALLLRPAGYGRPALVKLLLDAGASAAAKNVNGKTAADLT